MQTVKLLALLHNSPAARREAARLVAAHHAQQGRRAQLVALVVGLALAVAYAVTGLPLLAALGAVVLALGVVVWAWFQEWR